MSGWTESILSPAWVRARRTAMSAVCPDRALTSAYLAPNAFLASSSVMVRSSSAYFVPL